MKKLSKETKDYIKAVIKFYKAKEWAIKPESMEYEISRFIDNMNMEHRYLIEEFIQKEILKGAK